MTEMRVVTAWKKSPSADCPDTKQDTQEESQQPDSDLEMLPLKEDEEAEAAQKALPLHRIL